MQVQILSPQPNQIPLLIQSCRQRYRYCEATRFSNARRERFLFYCKKTSKVDRKDGADLLEKVLCRENLNKAYKRVKANKGASGVDGMTVNEALPWLKEHRNELLESIRNGKYKPSPVRRVEIPKDNGGVRKLGIPTVIDRVIQQAIAQVLIPIYEPKFSHGSYGYRPHRSAKDAILKVH